jgi:hypothetical protein
MGTSHPINGRKAWRRKPPAHPTGERFQIFSQAPPEGLFANKILIREETPDTAAGASRPPNGREVRGPYGGASCPLGGLEVPQPLYKPPSPKFPFYSAKFKKKRKGGEEERRESGKALFTRRFGGIFSFYSYNYLKIVII